MKNPGLPGFLLSAVQSLCKKMVCGNFSSKRLINRIIDLSSRFFLSECHRQVTDLSIFMAGAAIFLHITKKTKNSNTEKRFLFFPFSFVAKKKSNSSTIIFTLKINQLFLLGFFLFLSLLRVWVRLLVVVFPFLSREGVAKR
ncbi:hypothetical protein [Aeromonas sp. QDB62]|uniref:hypothetical protein n=1 Tax=Aeromonas sp. QDB62 TaxID=2990499 RepID=UPI0022E287CF|nr:hypothetical protein [Aeromonas sp. QDB62]